LAALGTRYQAEISALGSEEGLYAQGSAAWQKVIDQEMAKYQEFIAQRRQITDKAAEQDAKDWQAALTPIESAWNSQLRGLLAGTTTWAQAMKKIFADLAIEAIEKLESIGVEKLAGAIAGLVGGGPASLLGSAGSAAATTANTTALATLTAAVAANTIALAGETAASAGKAGADLVGGVGGIAGLFSALKPLLAIFGFEKGAWEIPGLAAGTWDTGVGSILAALHPGEMVVPQTFAQGLRSATAGGGGPFGSGGGGGVTHNWNITGPIIGTQQWLQQMKDQLAKAVNSSNEMSPSRGW
jgi:hypothetical protein